MAAGSAVLNKGALLRRGWTPELVAAVLGQPDKWEEHRRGFKHWTEHLYCEKRVSQGEGDPRFVEAMRRRRERIAAAERRRAEIPTKYVSWRAALPEAAAGMFSLNRYAKHRMCSELHKVEIYDLKNDFIRLLYRHGYCTVSWIHRLELAEQKCRECGGGADWDCDHCGGSGIWREARTLEFWCFRFLVGGQTYCWHQPKGSVEFGPAECVPPQKWAGLGGEKPVALPKRRFAMVKDLLRWVIDAAGNGDEAGRPSLEEEAVPFEFAGQSSPAISVSADAQIALFSA